MGCRKIWEILRFSGFFGSLREFSAASDLSRIWIFELDPRLLLLRRTLTPPTTPWVRSIDCWYTSLGFGRYNGRCSRSSHTYCHFKLRFRVRTTPYNPRNLDYYCVLTLHHNCNRGSLGKHRFEQSFWSRLLSGWAVSYDGGFTPTACLGLV